MLASGISFISCDPQRQIAGTYNYESECMGVEIDGSQTLHVWGNGRNRTDAIEQAKKNGVRDVLFKGIRAGKSECNLKPIVSEVNAQEKYEDYFNKFFADGGPYQNFISGKDGSNLHLEVIKNRKKIGAQETYRITVRVLRADLKAKMIADRIITQ
jgi:hypothetical protein